MKTTLRTAVLTGAGLLSLAAQQLDPTAFRPAARSPSGSDISWAFHETNGILPRESPTTMHTLSGTARTFTRAQIDDVYNAVDWFPDDHPPAPEVVTKGHGEAHACGVCHLMSGLGHPQSADITGLPVPYFRQTMADFKSGARIEPNHMNAIAKDLTDDEIRQTAEWYALLKPTRWTIVKEAETVPKTWIPRGRMRVAVPEVGSEPLGSRIIVLPQNAEAVGKRDPRSGFVAYAPIGSLKRGKNLVTMGGDGGTLRCSQCHGTDLKGVQDVPRLAGLHPTYIARQLYLFQDRRRDGTNAQSMKRVVERLTDGDIIDISAYLASLDPSANGSQR